MWSCAKVVLLVLSLLAVGSTGVSQIKSLKLRHGTTSMASVRFLPNGKRLVSASYDGTVMMWDVHRGKQVWKMDLDAGSKTRDSYTISHILGMDLSPTGAVIAISYEQSRVVRGTLTGKSEFQIALLDAGEGQLIKVFTGHSGLIGDLAFSPDGELLLSESGDRTARIWSVNEGREVLQVHLRERGAAVAFASDGRTFAVATQPAFNSNSLQSVGLYDVDTGQLLREFPLSKNQVTDLAFTPDGQSLAIASGDAGGMQVDIWPLTGRQRDDPFLMPLQMVKALAVSGDGRFFAYGGHSKGQGFVELRTIPAREELWTLRLESAVTTIDFSSDGKRLVVGTETGEVIGFSLQPR